MGGEGVNRGEGVHRGGGVNLIGDGNLDRRVVGSHPAFDMLRDDATCAEEITARLRVATLAAAAEAWIAARETSPETAATFERVFDDAGASVARLAPRWFELVADFAHHLGDGTRDAASTKPSRSAGARDETRAPDAPFVPRFSFRDAAVGWRPALEAFTAAAAEGWVDPSDIPPNAADVVCSLARAATCRSLPFAGRDFDRERWFFDSFDDDDASLVSDDASFFSDARHGHLSDGAPSDGQAALAARATRRVLAASGRGNVFDADPSAAAAAVHAVTAAISAGVGGDAFVADAAELLDAVVAREEKEAAESDGPNDDASGVDDAAFAAAALAAALSRRSDVSASSDAARALARVLSRASTSAVAALRPPLFLLAVRAVVDARRSAPDADADAPAVRLLEKLFDGATEASTDDDDDDSTSSAAIRAVASACDAALDGDGDSEMTPALAAATVMAASREPLEGGYAEDALARLLRGDADPETEAAAAATTRTRITQPAAAGRRRERAGALLARIGAAAAEGARRRAMSAAGTTGANARVVAAAEGLKLWASAVPLAEDEDARRAATAVFLSVAVEAAAPESAAANPTLREAATALVTRVAATAPNAFRAVAGALSEASTERLRNALRGGAAKTSAAMTGAGRVPEPSFGARAAAIPKSSFAAP